jgi:hypothetical protein
VGCDGDKSKGGTKEGYEESSDKEGKEDKEVAGGEAYSPTSLGW